jgi:hypothetical protein
MVDARFRGSQAIGVLAPAGQRDDRQPPVEVLRPDLPRRLIAANAWQPDVHDDHIGPQGGRGMHRRFAVVDHVGLVAERFQQRLQAVGRIPVVLGDQNA